MGSRFLHSDWCSMPQKLSRSSLNVSKNDIDTAVSADRTVISNEGKHFIIAFVLTPDSSSGPQFEYAC